MCVCVCVCVLTGDGVGRSYMMYHSLCRHSWRIQTRTGSQGTHKGRVCNLTWNWFVTKPVTLVLSTGLTGMVCLGTAACRDICWVHLMTRYTYLLDYIIIGVHHYCMFCGVYLSPNYSDHLLMGYQCCYQGKATTRHSGLIPGTVLGMRPRHFWYHSAVSFITGAENFGCQNHLFCPHSCSWGVCWVEGWLS